MNTGGRISRRLFLWISLAASAVSMGVSVRRKAEGKMSDSNVRTTRSLPARRASRGRKDIVSVVRCDSYNPERVFHALAQSLEAIRFSPPRRGKVLLKPNIIGQNSPEQAATTHFAVIDALCRYFSDFSCRVTIGDSSAFYQGGGTAEAFVTTRMSDVAKKYGARLLPFEATRLRKMESGRYLNPFYVTEAVFDHDCVVNVPKLKVHRLARYTGAIKNMYGCIPGGAKQVYHQFYQHRDDYQEFWGGPLVDVYEAVTPHLNVMDAIIGLDKNGPAANGEPKPTGLLITSRNGVALDLVACRIIGIAPERIPAVREAVDRGLSSDNAILVIGEVPTIPYVSLPDLKPLKGVMRDIDDYVFRQFIVTPRVNRARCTQCGACIENCAVNAIHGGDTDIPAIDYKRCIYCYCCKEYCAAGAISLKGSALNHIIRALRWMMKI